MNNLIIIAHPNKNSFCYNGIFKTIQHTSEEHNESVRTLDLYSDDFSRLRTSLVDYYKEEVSWSDRIYIISPVWWFRLTSRMETFFDEVFTPGFAYNSVPINEFYGYPKPLLSNKKVRTYLTHGALALPVKTLYFNSVKSRLVMGVYSFVFGWFKTKTRQFWSVPFVSQNKREKYLKRVEKDIIKDLK